MAGAEKSLSTRLRRAPTRYQPTRRLAVGGMAEVWCGDALFEDGDRHPVAIKRVLPHLALEPIYKSMFQDEARLGMALSHTNIVRVYDAREVGGTFIMIMEMVDGTSLKDLLDNAHQRSAPMPVPAALHIGLQLARALSYAHAATDKGRPLNVVHRDVSPHNLLLSRAGQVKLADFGLADADVQGTQLGDGMLGGKLGYLAPEIIHQQPNDHQVDIFALGIVLWEMLAGRRLFHRPNDAATVQAVAACEVPPVAGLNKGVTRGVASLLDDLLAPQPMDRLHSAGQAVKRLEALIDEIDRDVGYRDVALLVGLHLASVTAPAPTVPKALTELLAQELDAFATAAAGSTTSMGAQPLDPDAFLTGH
ncbi:MAG: serine/threonine-protein kinase [Sandaracinaceae bacterium]